MEMNPDTIRALLDAFDASDWQEMTVTIGADRLHVSRDGRTDGAPPDPPPAQLPAPAPAAEADPATAAAAPEPAATAPSAAAPPPAADDGSGAVVTSPSVGLFWRAPSPSSPPFVEVGARVAPGETVAIVEVMKLMNHVVSPVAGVVTAIHADNGAMVEYGQPLVAVDPEA